MEKKNDVYSGHHRRCQSTAQTTTDWNADRLCQKSQTHIPANTKLTWSWYQVSPVYKQTMGLGILHLLLLNSFKNIN